MITQQDVNDCIGMAGFSEIHCGYSVSKSKYVQWQGQGVANVEKIRRISYSFRIKG